MGAWHGVVIAAMVGWAGCARTTPASGPASAASAAEIGPWGVALGDVDPGVRPGDDFNRYANGRWLDGFVLPDAYSDYGSFTLLRDRSEERVRAIIEGAAADGGAPGSLSQQIGDLYASYLDTARIDAFGLAPLSGDLAAIAAATSHDKVAALLGRPGLAVGGPVRFGVDVDAKDPSRMILYVGQGGLTLPNRDYYVAERFADKVPALTDYAATLFELAGLSEARRRAEGVVALEQAMAQLHWPRARQRDRDLTYNLRTVPALEAEAPGLPWGTLLGAAGLGGVSEVVVEEHDAIVQLAALFAATPVATWQDYLRLHLLDGRADVLPSAFDDAHFHLHGTTLRGTPAQKERWKRAVAATNGALGEAVGQLYVARWFPPESKAAMEQLVGWLRTALDARLDTLDWMGDATRAAAHDKLAKFTPKIGYPDTWRAYDGLEIQRGDAYGNATRASAFAWRWQVSLLDQPVDRTRWEMTPQTVNAYYNSTLNEIVFPAAILQAPFFDPHADAAVNFGAIGAVIGHEIGHGFDDQGRKSDGDGRLRDWWTPEDATRFEALAQRLGAQYASYEPIPGFPVNPALTMGENIGDLGGLAMAWHAYNLSLQGQPAPVLDGTTGAQRFFLAWAQVWKRVQRDEHLKNQVATDPHSPARYRINGIVRNMDAWVDAFGVTEGDDLWLPPEQRVVIW